MSSGVAVAAPPPRPSVLLIGDSLTQRGTDPDNAGWISLLQHRYHRSADIISRGLSGYNTKWFIEAALPVIDHELSSASCSPALITLWLGANDAALPDGDSARQHVPLATYAANLTEIVRAFQVTAPEASILLITPPHVDDAVRQTGSHSGRAERTNAVAGEYARSCVEVAHELGISVLDLHSFFNAMSVTDRAACLEDGLHFSARGNRLVDEQLRAKIATAFPELERRLNAWQLPNFHIWMDE
ncbi:hypothetical protein BBJ28_00006545 [Nothophytophthora sp. Chile5]|nr:hypothetical protein BBJ28_00006545 [Nothophytophthora sp. Chile5]